MAPLSTSTLNMLSWQPATRISRVPLEVKFMHLKSLNSALLYNHRQPLLVYAAPLSFADANIRQMPVSEAATVRVVNALFRDGEDALVGEEKLLDGPIGRSMSAVRGISLEVWSVEGRDPALCVVSYPVPEAGRVRTYSHGCYPSRAAPASCQRQMSRWARRGHVVRVVAVERLLAVDLSATMRLHCVVFVAGQAWEGPYLVPVRLHGESACRNPVDL